MSKAHQTGRARQTPWTRRRWAALAFAFTLCAGCGPASTAQVGSLSSAVVGGTPIDASTYPATGALLSVFPSGATVLLCAATLIAPRVVLTAAHCVSKMTGRLPDFALIADVADASQAASLHSRRIHVHPGFDPTSTGPMHDIALVELDAAVEAVAPDDVLDPSEAATLLVPGASVNLVGYGPTTVQGIAGAKNAAPARIASVNDAEMTIGGPGEAQNCVGDSGGPSYVLNADGTRRIAGVVSRSANNASECIDGSIHTRVDAHAAWIAATLGAIANDRSSPAGCAMAQAVSNARSLLGPVASMALVAMLRRRRRCAQARRPDGRRSRLSVDDPCDSSQG